MAFVRTTLFILTGFLLFTNYLSAQQKITNYTNLWKKVDSLSLKKGLTQSALEEVNKIYALAKKEKQDAQVIKALIYKMGLQDTKEDDEDIKSIIILENEIKTSIEPAKSILYSLLADKYNSYYINNSFELRDRTKTSNFKKEDIATWSVDDFQNKIVESYLSSIKNEKLLQQTKLEPFDQVITKGNARYLRPTLYDLLANRALGYFKDDDRDVTNPAYAFEIKTDDYFSIAPSFIKLKIITKDSASLYHKALLIYQQLLALHIDDAKPDALVDADINRLEFVNQYGVMENKKLLYEKALGNITEKYKTLPAAAQAYYLIAEIHSNKAANYDPLKYDDKDPSNPKGEYSIAADICKKVLEQKEESEGKTNCYNLLQQIEKKELYLITEKVNLPQQDFRTLVSYRNFSKLYFRLVLFTDDLKTRFTNRNDDKYWGELVALKPFRNWDQSLPVTNDYQKHSTEIKVAALPIGQYILLAGTNEDFSLDKNPLAVQYFYVSGISYINNDNEYFILDRESGKPLAGATVQTWRTSYDYNSRTNKKVKGEKQTADKNGYLLLSKTAINRLGNLQLEISKEDDKLFMDDQQYVYYREADNNNKASTASQYEKDNSTVFFFTDRAIYRPGQIVYFKGISLTKDFTTKKNKVYSNIKSKVYLRNANGEDIDSIELNTNEYGSYSGKFVLPQGTLNGIFTLRDINIKGNTSFSMEEYKRPVFSVEYETIKGSYKVNDSVSIIGFAKAYAGNNIDGAQIKFRVQRVARFIYPWLYWKWGYPRANNIEITNGVTTTDAEGKFKITFKAIPDLTINKDLEPVFDYKINADITDINGETRSGETTVPVAYKALQLNIGLEDGQNIIADSLKNISISTKNIAGTPEPALITMIISKLQSPDRLIRERYWQQPDQFVLNKEEFRKTFPNDEYSDESNFRSWAKDKAIFTSADSSNDNSKFKIQNLEFVEGWYAIEAITKDKYGAEVKDIKYIQLYDERSKFLPYTAYKWSSQKNNTIEPGEQSTITIGSAANDVFLIQEIDKPVNQPSNPAAIDNNTISTKYNFINLTGKQSFTFTATEEDRGGFGIYHFFVKNNRFYSLSNNINIPWTNKDLQISYESFRDKTLPGSDEKWKLKINGYKNEKVAAEMLATMYDASLDQLKPNSWDIPDPWENYYPTKIWAGHNNFNQVQSQIKYLDDELKVFYKHYDELMTQSGQPLWWTTPLDYVYDEVNAPRYMKLSSPLINDASLYKGNKIGYKKENVATYLNAGTDTYTTQTEMFVHANIMKKIESASDIPVQIRKNFNETAFFFPDLKTDSAGNISFGFTIPEALTRWKFQALAHTKNLAFGYSTNNVVTQKPLMVQPNAPRFMREGDKMELSAKVVNLTDKELTGTVELDLMNTATNQPVDGWFHNMYPTQYFTAEANQSTSVKFSIDVPYQYNSALSYRFVAKAGKNTDGEEASLPVLTNNMLATESMPLPMRGNAAKNFRFEKLLQSGNSETLQQHALTVEFTTNPAWYAVQALPYLMEYPYECAEQTFNRYYANALATKIANASPRLKDIFEKWETTDTAALVSNLQKNPELKTVLLEETPWVMEAKNETQQKKNIALLFNMMRMNKELSASFKKLKQMQSSNGGFVWFKGGPDDRYITQYILTGIGHLKKLDALNATQQKDWATVISSALKYLDLRLKDDYDVLIKHKTNLSDNNLGYTQVQYLYMRSFFSEYNVAGASFTAVNYFRKQSQQYWLQQNKYMQGMIALALFRSFDTKTADEILKSLKQNAIVTEELGMYWKDNTAGYYWHQAPVETQSLLIEAFTEISKDTKTINDLKTWLLKQKQTQNWKTTKATAEACYALLLQGSDWLNNTPDVEVKLGDKTISSSAATGSGTGYFKQTIDGPFVKPAMGEITVKIASSQNQSTAQPAWGAVYWQYFEQLDKLNPSATPLQLSKKLFVERNTDKGPVLDPIAENAYVKVGDKIKVRIELRVDRDMEYVHMKDMRASCMEPVNVLSEYKWQGGLGYYESTKDASTNFFFSWLPKGTYVFEYPLFVTHAGNFSNGVTSIQCMYAPEFTSHSEGVRINAE